MIEGLTKISERIIIEICDNGYIVELSGRNESGDFEYFKIVCKELTELVNVIADATKLDVFK